MLLRWLHVLNFVITSAIASFNIFKLKFIKDCMKHGSECVVQRKANKNTGKNWKVPLCLSRQTIDELRTFLISTHMQGKVRSGLAGYTNDMINLTTRNATIKYLSSNMLFSNQRKIPELMLLLLLDVLFQPQMLTIMKLLVRTKILSICMQKA